MPNQAHVSNTEAPAAKGHSRFRRLWLCLAATLPLSAFASFRLNIEPIKVHIALPMLVMGLIGIGVILVLLTQRVRVQRAITPASGLWLIFLCYAFLMWHVVGTMHSDHVVVAARDTVKVGIGILCMSIVICFFPRELVFLERFWNVVLGATGVIFAVLVYQNFFVHHATSLGAMFHEDNSMGRNQMTGYLVYVIPFSWASFWWIRKFNRDKVIAFFTLSTLLVAWLYASSRGAWAAVVAGAIPTFFILPAFFTGRRLRAIYLRSTALVLGGAWAAVQYVDLERLALLRRFQYLYDPGSVPELKSYDSRFELMRQAFVVFLDAPIFGAGLRDTEWLISLDGRSYGLQVHNDYVGTFSDLGLIGGCLLLGIVGLVTWQVWHRTDRRLRDSSWVFLGTRFALVAVLVYPNFMLNVIRTNLFWVFLGLALVASEVEKRHRESQQVRSDGQH